MEQENQDREPQPIMKPRKHIAPQFELFQAPFNLELQTTIDGARVATEQEQARRDREAQEKKQCNLFALTVEDFGQ